MSLLLPIETERLTAICIGVTSDSWHALAQVRQKLPEVIADALSISINSVSIGPTKTVKGSAKDVRALPNLTEADPYPKWMLPIYLDEKEYDVEDIAMLGNELFLTIMERSHEGLRDLGVCYAEPP